DDFDITVVVDPPDSASGQRTWCPDHIGRVDESCGDRIDESVGDPFERCRLGKRLPLHVLPVGLDLDGGALWAVEHECVDAPVNRRVWAVPPGVAPEVDRLMIVDVDDDLGHECRSRVFGTDRVEDVSGFHLPAPNRIFRALTLSCSATSLSSSPPRKLSFTAFSKWSAATELMLLMAIDRSRSLSSDPSALR